MSERRKETKEKRRARETKGGKATGNRDSRLLGLVGSEIGRDWG